MIGISVAYRKDSSMILCLFVVCLESESCGRRVYKHGMHHWNRFVGVDQAERDTQYFEMREVAKNTLRGLPRIEGPLAASGPPTFR